MTIIPFTTTSSARCGGRLSSGLRMVMTSCGHLFCYSCGQAATQPCCFVCRHPAPRALPMDNSLPQKYKEMFNSTEETLAKMKHRLAFQKSQVEIGLGITRRREEAAGRKMEEKRREVGARRQEVVEVTKKVEEARMRVEKLKRGVQQLGQGGGGQRCPYTEARANLGARPALGSSPHASWGGSLVGGGGVAQHKAPRPLF